ncbi:MAG: murein transglycosylase [Alphaproteobacteria bacterium]|nr:MAG: murein transglycosylase [Alphaproteobacteria bacterium]
MKKNNFFRTAGFLALAILAGCATPSVPPTATIDTPKETAPVIAPRRAIALDQLPGWSSEDPLAAVQGLKAACPKLIKRGGDNNYFGNKYADRIAPARWQEICADARTVSNESGAAYFWQQNFEAIPMVDGDKNTGLITGYYEAELHGSLKKSEKFRYPLYKMPSDKYLDLSRREIDHGALQGKKLELVWIDDPVSVFALHIQGSGRVTLDDGRVMRVGFAGKNRQPYYSIGKAIGEQNILPKDKIEMASIEKWLRNNPERAATILQTNPSYIFFRQIDGLAEHHEGPIGAYGLPLIPERSIAVDRAFYPLGIPMWIDAAHPVNGAPLQKIVYAFDTGSAIKGKIRADYFFGSGDDAKYAAGQMRGRGKLYAIVPRGEIAVSSK